MTSTKDGLPLNPPGNLLGTPRVSSRRYEYTFPASPASPMSCDRIAAMLEDCGNGTPSPPGSSYSSSSAESENDREYFSPGTSWSMHHHHRERCWLGDFSSATSTPSLELNPADYFDRGGLSPTIEETGVNPSALALALSASVMNLKLQDDEETLYSPPIAVATASNTSPPLHSVSPSSSAHRPLYNRFSSSTSSSSSSSSNSPLSPSTIASRLIHPKLKSFKPQNAPVPPSLLARRRRAREQQGSSTLPMLSAGNISTGSSKANFRPVPSPLTGGSSFAYSPSPLQFAGGSSGLTSVEGDVNGDFFGATSAETTPVLTQASFSDTHHLYPAFTMPGALDIDLMYGS